MFLLMKSLSSRNFDFTTNFTTNSPQQLAPSCPILPRCQLKHTFYKFSESLANKGIPGQNKEKQNYDKSIIHLPRQDFPGMMKSLISSHKSRF